jgi:hypothetical protein
MKRIIEIIIQITGGVLVIAVTILFILGIFRAGIWLVGNLRAPTCLEHKEAVQKLSICNAKLEEAHRFLETK